MQLIHCPWCGDREEDEFSYGGQAHVAYPADPTALDDERWAAYLYVRDNHRGPFLERWCHGAGCRRWFNAARDTATHRFLGTYRPGQAPPVTVRPITARSITSPAITSPAITAPAIPSPATGAGR
jgi:heterotetrameric sarcosine oxidase delta subunit